MHAHSVHVAQSDTEAEKALGNPMYGQQITSVSTSSKTPLGRYSSTGPEYEPVHTAKAKGGSIQSNEDHHTQPDSNIIFRPASYEIPINSGTHTLNTT